MERVFVVEAPQSPLRRWFGTPTAVHVSLLSPETQAKLGAVDYIERHALRDLLVGSGWRAEWDTAVSRGRELEAVVIGRRATALAEGVAPNVGGKLVRQAIDATTQASDAISKRLGLDKSASEVGKAAVGAGLTTPLTKTGVLGDVVFSTASNVAETLLRSGKLEAREQQVDTGTAIAYDVATGTAAGVVGTLAAVVATPVVGVAVAVATKLGMDAARDPVVWRAAELVAGVRAAVGFTKKPS